MHDVGDMELIPWAGGMCAGETVHLVLVGHHVAHAVTRGGVEDGMGELGAVADSAAADVEGDVAAVGVVLQLAVGRVVVHHEGGAHRSQTAAAVERAENLAVAVDVDLHVATHRAGGDGGAAESAAAAEDVAVVVRRAPGADEGRAADVHLDIVLHVAVLSAAVHGAEDGAADHRDTHIVHVGTLVEGGALVTLAGAVEEAGHRVRLDGRQGAGHADGASRHGHRAAVTQHIGILAAAVDRGQDVAAADGDMRVAAHTALELVPLAEGGVGRVIDLPCRDAVGVVARAAAEHIAEEGVAVAGVGGGGVALPVGRGGIRVGVGVVGQIVVGGALDGLAGGVVVRPAVAFRHVGGRVVEGRRIGSRGGVVIIGDGGGGSSPETVGVGCRLALAAADLAALYLHHAVVQHLAVLAAAPHGAHDEGRAADGHVGIVHIAEAGVLLAIFHTVDVEGVGVSRCAGLRVVAHAGTEHIAQVGRHGDIGRAHLAAADGHRGLAGVGGAAVLLAQDEGRVACDIGVVGIAKGAHRGHLAAAEEGVVHIAARHGHGGILRHGGQLVVVVDVVAAVALAAAEYVAVVLVDVLRERTHVAVGQVHRCAAVHHGNLAAAVDGVEDFHVVICRFRSVQVHLRVGGHLAGVDIVLVALAAAEHTAVVAGSGRVEGSVAAHSRGVAHGALDEVHHG